MVVVVVVFIFFRSYLFGFQFNPFFFFFLISKEILLKRPRYTRSIERGKEPQRIQRSSNSSRELMEKTPIPLIHLYNKWKDCSFKSGMERPESSKWQTIRQITTFLSLPKCPCWLDKRSSMVLSMTHWTPNKPNIISHNSRATLQWSKRWSGLSPLALHIQHHSTKIRSCLCRLSIVKIFPNVADQEKSVQSGADILLLKQIYGDFSSLLVFS